VPVSKEGESLFCTGPRDSFAESRIREAIERGDFAKVPGSGRPLDLGEENPFAGDMEVATGFFASPAVRPSGSNWVGK